jgi:hypothetical protein
MFFVIQYTVHSSKNTSLKMAMREAKAKLKGPYCYRKNRKKMAMKGGRNMYQA